MLPNAVQKHSNLRATNNRNGTVQKEHLEERKDITPVQIGALKADHSNLPKKEPAINKSSRDLIAGQEYEELDMIHIYWQKKLRGVHTCLLTQINKLLAASSHPDC